MAHNSFDRICEVQSDKAIVEITRRYDGTISSLEHEKGDMVRSARHSCSSSRSRIDQYLFSRSSNDDSRSLHYPQGGGGAAAVASSSTIFTRTLSMEEEDETLHIPTIASQYHVPSDRVFSATTVSSSTTRTTIRSNNKQQQQKCQGLHVASHSKACHGVFSQYIHDCRDRSPGTSLGGRCPAGSPRTRSRWCRLSSVVDSPTMTMRNPIHEKNNDNHVDDTSTPASYVAPRCPTARLLQCHDQRLPRHCHHHHHHNHRSW